MEIIFHCWRRLVAWNRAGVWDALHLVLLRKLRAAKKLDWSRAVIDSSHVRATRRVRTSWSRLQGAAPSERCSAYGEAVPEAVRCAASGRSLVSRYFRGAQVFTVLPLNWVQICVFLGYFAPEWPSLPQPVWASHRPRIL